MKSAEEYMNPLTIVDGKPWLVEINKEAIKQIQLDALKEGMLRQRKRDAEKCDMTDGYGAASPSEIQKAILEDTAAEHLTIDSL